MSLISSINDPSALPVRVVCFDIGGVLIKINRRWEDAMFAAGVRGTATGHLTEFKPLEVFQRGDMSEEEFYPVLKDFLGVESDEAAANILNYVLYEPYPGTLELIEDMNDLGIITACLSNTNAPHWAEMHNSGRFPNFNALKLRLASQELRLDKPDPAIFRAFEDAAKSMPQEIVFFDDTEEHVEAARERGWKAHWIDHTGDTAEQMEILLVGEGVLPIS
jgi:HAD superfamily hydrolase (TIGR01509 family)